MEVDLHETFGIDIHDPELLKSRSWTWLRNRLMGLLSTDCRIHREAFPAKQTQTSH